MDPVKAEYLRRLGIVRYVPRAAPAGAAPAPAPAMHAGSVQARSEQARSEQVRSIEAPAPAPAPAGQDLEVLAAAVARCTACGLHRGRTQTVFGCGSAGARWMVVGEGPGAEEDRQGLPFVGRAGQLLTAMLAAIGVTRDAVYIANTVKCRPPQNRDPTPAEMAACRPFLEQQMALVQPALILAVGRIAAQSLLATDLPLARLRGRVHHYPGSLLPVVATYHPAYLLRSPREKRKAWEDLLYARAQIAP